MTHEYFLEEGALVVETSTSTKLKRWLHLYWKYIVLIMTPILCSPLLIIMANEEAICAYLLIVMATYWATEALPLPVTALIPVFYLPLTGIMPTEEVTMLYMKASTMMFITSVIVALSIEEVGLHKRVAINTLLLFGGKVEWLIIGFVLPTWFLSLWISNVATTSMMLPCTTAVLVQLSASKRTLLKMAHSNEKAHHKNHRSKKCDKINHQHDNKGFTQDTYISAPTLEIIIEVEHSSTGVQLPKKNSVCNGHVMNDAIKNEHVVNDSMSNGHMVSDSLSNGREVTNSQLNNGHVNPMISAESHNIKGSSVSLQIVPDGEANTAKTTDEIKPNKSSSDLTQVETTTNGGIKLSKSALGLAQWSNKSSSDLARGKMANNGGIKLSKSSLGLAQGTTTPSGGMRRNKSSFDLAPYQQEEAEIFLARLAKAFTLSVAYAANVGGVGTSTGTTPNIVMKGFADSIWRSHGYSESPVNFATWTIIGLPVAFFNLIFLLFWMQLHFVGFRKTLTACVCWRGERDTTADEAVKKLLRREKDLLGKMRFEEIVVAIVFTLMVLLWFFRSPGFMPGWGDLPIFKDGYIHETVVSCVMVVVLFVISPKLPKCWTNPSADDKKPESILKWKNVEDKFPWGIIFLFGGGFALAEACTRSGLSQWMGDQLAILGMLPSWVMLTIICLFTITLANVMSSSATCSLLCPIVASMAESMGKNPLYLMFPVAISSSVAFLLPISNPTNALAYSRRNFKVMDMIINGAPLTIFGIACVVFFTLTAGDAFFDWETYPWEYAATTQAAVTDIATHALCNTVSAS